MRKDACRLFGTQFANGNEQERLPLDSGQPGYGRQHAFLFDSLDSTALRAGRPVAIADQTFDGYPQPAAEQRAARSPPGYGKHKRLRGVRGTGLPPTLHQCGQTVLGDLFSQRSVTRPRQAVAEQSRCKVPHGRFNVHVDRSTPILDRVT